MTTRFLRRPAGGVEADLLEVARTRLTVHSPAVIWVLLVVSVGLSVVSLLVTQDEPAPTSLEVVALLLAGAVAVVLISAGTLALHGSRQSRWDAPLTVGLGAVLLGMGTSEQVLLAAEAANDVGSHQTAPALWILTVLRWAGLCLVVGGLVWRAGLGWPARGRLAALAVVMVAPVAVASSWTVVGETGTAVERVVLAVFAVVLFTVAIRLMRSDTDAPIIEGGTVLGSGLALAVILQAGSVHPGDIASIAGLSWLLLAGLLTALWFDHQAALRTVSHRTQTERYVRLLEDIRREIDRAAGDRSVLRHNGTSSLLAIEGGLDALGASIASGDVSSHERMTRALVSEIGRLRRMLAIQATAEPPRANLLEAVDAVVHLARSRGQLIAVHVPEGVAVAARQDSVAEVLHNLLDNAATHAPGSVVAIEATIRPDGLVELVVEDDGPGVPAELAERIFDEGVSRRPGPNVGLGLYAARRLAREGGGDLELLPPNGRGAVFRLLLPPAPAATVTGLHLVDEPLEAAP